MVWITEIGGNIMKGIDISIFQGHIDFKKVKATGVEVVIIKATQGTGYTNAMLAEHYKGAKANGLKIGFYHYLTKDNPIVQARQFLEVTNGLIADCKYIMDVEGEWTIRQASEATRSFADYLIHQKKEVAIYTGDYFYRDNLNSTVKDLPVWIANYSSNIMAKNNIGVQYSETGTVNGIIGHVDLDTFNAGILLTPKVAAKPTLKIGTVTATTLNVREDAGTGFKVIGQLHKGDKVTIAKAIGPNWYSIYFGNHGGYVSSEFIK